MLCGCCWQAEYEYQLLGHAAEEFPGLMPYCLPCEHQPLMTGAEEEAAGGLACGLLPAAVAPGEEVEGLPEGLGCSPFMNLQLDARYSDPQVWFSRLNQSVVMGPATAAHGGAVVVDRQQHNKSRDAYIRRLLRDQAVE